MADAAGPGQTGPAIVEARDLHKSFDGTAVLRGISLDVAEGELVSLIGPSGCGKSTFLRCLNLLEIPDAGSVSVAGISVARQSKRWGRADEEQAHRLRRGVGMVFQGFNLFAHRTVLDNVMLAPRVVQLLPRERARARALALLDKVGLADVADRYPATLSGGQQQRAAIARALACEPRVMLYDEPTSALDPELTDEVLAVMRQLDRDGMTQIVVTHEMRFARAASDRIAFMQHGRIVEIAAPASLFANPAHPDTRRFLKHYFL
ncbi:amino acid ABC transporter ATP-binding protein [Lichenicoccus sp.]|uniref:amino acid ABC transporter ATP-binding protein n=1 Tax=Lichenicoccus sp. TaxID=2781899 RepID=UPI003D10751C